MLKVKNFLILFMIFFISCGPSIEERRELYKSKYSWDDKIIDIILEGKIKIGMTQEQVTESWGKPVETWTSITKNFKKEQWRFWGIKQHLFFYDYFDGKGLLLESIIE